MTEIPYATVIKACWQIAETQGLGGLTPETIAAQVPLDVAVLRRLFPTPSHILRALMQDVFGNVPLNMVASGSPRDNLFDLIMAHFDGLQSHRPAVMALYKDLISPRHLDLLIRLRKPYWQQVGIVMDSAGIATDDLLGWGKISLVAFLGLWLLPVWVSDESEDLSKTMAVLDQGLQRLGDINSMVASFGC
jgi:hypothetical protein